MLFRIHDATTATNILFFLYDHRRREEDALAPSRLFKKKFNGSEDILFLKIINELLIF